MVRRSPPSSSRAFKACKNCKYLVPIHETQCPNCGSTEFVEEWTGMIIILSPEKSRVAKALGITKPGRFALQLGPT